MKIICWISVTLACVWNFAFASCDLLNEDDYTLELNSIAYSNAQEKDNNHVVREGVFKLSNHRKNRLALIADKFSGNSIAPGRFAYLEIFVVDEGGIKSWLPVDRVIGTFEKSALRIEVLTDSDIYIIKNLPSIPKLYRQHSLLRLKYIEINGVSCITSKPFRY